MKRKYNSQNFSINKNTLILISLFLLSCLLLYMFNYKLTYLSFIEGNMDGFYFGLSFSILIDIYFGYAIFHIMTIKTA